MRPLNLAFLLATAVCFATARGQEPTAADRQNTDTKEAPLRMNLATEAGQSAKIRMEIQTVGANERVVKKMEDLPPGSAEAEVSALPDGDYFVFFSAPGYAAQWKAMAVKQGKAEPNELKVQLFRKRYVVLHYVFNTSGGRGFTNDFALDEGRAAVAHWGGLPYFNRDWQIWQRSSGADPFGDTPFLEYHRMFPGFGFAPAPEGVAFADLKEAPADAQYKCQSIKAEKGLTLYCRVMGNAGMRDNGLGYGKVVVEEVTETPPPGITVIEGP